jgi:hypothetical protein
VLNTFADNVKTAVAEIIPTSIGVANNDAVIFVGFFIFRSCLMPPGSEQPMQRTGYAAKGRKHTSTDAPLPNPNAPRTGTPAQAQTNQSPYP